MKLFIVLALVAVAFARPDDHYDSKYDNFKVDEVISNERLLKAYAHCFIGDGKCTPEGSDIKEFLPEAMSSSCIKCTDKQKEHAAKTIKAMKEKIPVEYAILRKQTDPEDKYGAALEEFVTKYSG